MNLRHRAMVLAASSALLAGAGLSIGIATASASVGGCSYQIQRNDVTGIAQGVRGICTSGTSEYREVGTCTDELRGSSVKYYGAYVTKNHYSTAVCPFQGGTE